MAEIPWAALHWEQGCYGCEYADKDQLGKGAACTKPNKCVAR